MAPSPWELRREWSSLIKNLASCSVESSGWATHLQRPLPCATDARRDAPAWFCWGRDLWGWRFWFACLEGSALSSMTSAVREEGITVAHTGNRIYVCLEQSHLSDKCRKRKAIHKVQRWVREKELSAHSGIELGGRGLCWKGPAFLKGRADKEMSQGSCKASLSAPPPTLAVDSGTLIRLQKGTIVSLNLVSIN